MATELQPIPPDPIAENKLWRDFFSTIFEILKTNQSTDGTGGNIPFNNIDFPVVAGGTFFAGPPTNPGKPSFRALQVGDINIALFQWEGSAFITTVGNISSGTWQGDIITNNYLEPDPLANQVFFPHIKHIPQPNQTANDGEIQLAAAVFRPHFVQPDSFNDAQRLIAGRIFGV